MAATVLTIRTQHWISQVNQIELLQLITLDVPSFNDLKENIKHYHSNCFAGMDYPSYKKENLQKYQAIDVLSGNERND